MGDADGPEVYLMFNDQSSAAAMREVLGRNRSFTPEHALCWAVLKDALESFSLTDQSRRKREIKTDAVAWLNGEIAPGGLSFEAVCALLGLDEGAVRKRAFSGEFKEQYGKSALYWRDKKRGEHKKSEYSRSAAIREANVWQFLSE